MGSAVARVSRTDPLKRILLAGIISGLVVLGIGGRLLMRGLAYTTPEAPRFALAGTLQVIGAGLAWGAITAPLLARIPGLVSTRPRVAGVIHGVIVLAVAVLVFLVATGGGGRIVAPASFVVLSGVLFPMLFIVHGLVVVLLAYGRRRDHPRSDHE